MSSQVLWHRPLARDEVVGRVELDGRAYKTRVGPDEYVGRVELDSGKIFEERLGPDKYVGRVALDSGKVYRHKPIAPDEYLGRVDTDGQFYRHKPIAPDEYLGKLLPMPGYAYGGAAFLLLILPAWQEEHEAKQSDPEPKEAPGSSGS